MQGILKKPKTIKKTSHRREMNMRGKKLELCRDEGSEASVKEITKREKPKSVLM